MRPIAFLMAIGLVLSGCASLMSSQSTKLAENLAAAILDNDDLDTVRDGAPAYLIMIDSLIAGDPDNEALLRAGANLYSAYSTIFVTDKSRQQRLTDKAFNYAQRAACYLESSLCYPQDISFNDLKASLDDVSVAAVPSLYTLGSSWASWIQVRSDNWEAVADLAKVRAILENVALQDESYQRGVVHVYLGGLSTLLPPALGGKPEIGRQHFKRAITLSKGDNLMAKVIYADSYARLMFDQQLHDQLLQEVLAADSHVHGYTLMNTLAKKRAHELLKSSDEYF